MAFTASWIYQIVDKYSGPMKKIRKQTDRMRKATKRAQDSVNKFGAKMTNAQSGIASFAGILGGGMMLSTFNNFETSMNKLGAVSLATSEQMQQFRGMAKKLGETTQFSASQAAQGMVFLKMAGLSANEVLEAIPGTLQLAAAGGMDLASAADIATNVLAQMKLPISELTRVNDVLATVQSSANTSIFEAAEAMKNTGTSATAMGLSIEQTTAMIGAMANAGLKGGQAGTLFRNMLKNMVAPTDKARGLLRKYNIDMSKFVTPAGKIKDLTGFITEMSSKNVTAGDSFKILGERGVRAFQALEARGVTEINSLTAALSKSEGNAQKMADIMMKGLPGALKILKSVWEATIIALFESGLVDLVLGIAKGISGLLQKIASANPFILKMAGIMGLLAVAIGPVLMTLGFMAMSVSALMGLWTSLAGIITFTISPVIAIGAAIAFLVGLLIRAFTTNSRLRESFVKLLSALSPLIAPLKMIWDMLGGMESVTGGLVYLFDLLADIVGSVLVAAFEVLAITVKGLLTPLSLIMKGANILFGTEGGGVASGGNAGAQNTLNGNINVTASGGAQVQSAEMDSTGGGNLGFNMGGG